MLGRLERHSERVPRLYHINPKDLAHRLHNLGLENTLEFSHNAESDSRSCACEVVRCGKSAESKR